MRRLARRPDSGLRIPALVAFVLCVSVMAAAPAGAETGSVLGTWTVNGGGHCIEHRLLSYSPGPLSGGDLFQWLGSSQLCDPAGAPGVAGLWLRTALNVPSAAKWSCPWRNLSNYSGGSSTRAVDPSSSGAAVSYFEAGDGTTPPPDAVGISNGRRPEVLGVCAGTWHLSLTSYVLPVGSSTWSLVGKSVYALSVGENPAFAQPRSVQRTFDGTTVGEGHCIHNTMNVYDSGPVIAVGDPLEFTVVHSSCDSVGRVSGITIHDAIRPPAGCASAVWPRSGVGGGGGVLGDPPSLWMARYGPSTISNPGVPPDFTPPSASGQPHDAVIFVNCPGAWVVSMRTWVDSGGTTSFVGMAKFRLDVAPHP